MKVLEIVLRNLFLFFRYASQDLIIFQPDGLIKAFPVILKL